ncbi:MAG: hypothetical protein AB7U85_11290, partial [Alphaproteobacteria bacterium]
MPRKVTEPEAKRKSQVHIYLTEEEKVECIRLAKAFGLSVSDYFRLLALNKKLPKAEEREELKVLLKINADLARLGNLFKMALDEDENIESLTREIAEIINTRELL